jgi:hypothetical protein
MWLKVVLGIVVVIAALVFWIQLKWRRACRAGAEKIYRNLRALYAGEHRYRVADEADFPGLDLSGYRAVADVLTAQGFHYQGAIENLSVSSVYPENRTFTACYRSPDGAFGAGTYRVQGMQIVDFIAELSDGRYLATTNAALDKLTPPPQVLKRVLPLETPPDQILAAHRDRMASLRAAEPAATFVTASSLDEVIALSKRFSRVAADHRRSVGLLTEAEMMAMATSPEQAPTVQRVWVEFQALRDRDAPQANADRASD